MFNVYIKCTYAAPLVEYSAHHTDNYINLVTSIMQGPNQKQREKLDRRGIKDCIHCRVADFYTYCTVCWWLSISILL